MFEAVSLTLLGVVFIFLIVFEVYITFAEKKDISVWRKIPVFLIIALIIFIMMVIRLVNNE